MEAETRIHADAGPVAVAGPSDGAMSGTGDAPGDAPHVLSPAAAAARTPLPAHFRDCPAEVLMLLVVDMLQRLVQHNDRIPLTTGSVTRFHSRAPPGWVSIAHLMHGRFLSEAAPSECVQKLVILMITRHLAPDPRPP